MPSITIAALLATIVVIELFRLVGVYKKVSKKAYFKQRLESVKKMIWDLEFKVFKSREVREDIRKMYADANARTFSLQEQLKAFPEDGNVDEKNRIQDQIDLHDRDAKRYEAQLKQIDLEIEGSKPTAEFKDGVEGVVQQIEQLQEVKGMLKDWIKQQ